MTTPGVYRHEAKLLCLKIVATFVLVFDNSNGVISQKALTSVTGIDHYTKLLLRIGLLASTKLQVAGLVETQLDKFLQPLESLETWIKLVQELDAQLDATPLPSTNSSFPNQTDICMSCSRPVEERCFSSQTEGGRRFSIYNVYGASPATGQVHTTETETGQ
jgi:hypothetical protein